MQDLDDASTRLAAELRLALDYLRYLDPRYRAADKLRARARRRVISTKGRRVADALARVPGGVGVLRGALGVVERAIPRRAEVDALLRRYMPDVLLITPLIELGAPQTDFVRSARALGIPSLLPVYSWDNLTNKGVMREIPDLVTVWNEPMRGEAIQLHGVPSERVVVTGAPAYDHWFTWPPSSTRQEFCARVGLPADTPYVLYVCSSNFIAPDEVSFVRYWLENLRGHTDRGLREVAVLVRPHPQNAGQWREVDLSSLGPVSIWPQGGDNPVTRQARENYFDSIYHSAGVMGINTSALIESAIVGRSVHTLLAPEFKSTQEGTLHFHHLLGASSGLLFAARSFEEHARNLLAALSDDESWRRALTDRNRRFLESFVRPYGLEQLAASRLADAIEALATRPAPEPMSDPLSARVLRPAVDVLAGYRYTQVVGLPTPARPRVTTPRSRSGLFAPASRLLNATALGSRIARATSPSPSPNGHTLSSSPGKLEFAELDEPERLEFLWRNRELIPEAFWQRMDQKTTRYGTLDYDRVVIRIRTSTKAEQRRLLARTREPWTVEWLEQSLTAGDVLYDIGANVGAYSLIAAMQPEVSVQVVAFEPSAANFLSLCHNIAINQVADRVIPLPIALSDGTGLSNFNYRSLSSGTAQHALEGSTAARTVTLDFAPVFRQPVLTYRVDDAISALSLPPPTHLKIDVDGAELGVLHGAAETLRSPSLRTVLIEISVSLSDEATRVLEAAGFALSQRVERPTKTGAVEVWYGVFERRA
jgi:FkbM family methyltransferase